MRNNVWWALVLWGCVAPAWAAPPLSVGAVDLSRYQGTWHEIARMDHWFQRGCEQSEARYTLRDDGRMTVRNRCRTTDGGERTATGQAEPVDGRTDRLRVSFGFFSRLFSSRQGNYWIVGLDADYRWALVGHPNREYLWILAREPSLPAATLARIQRLARAQGYDTERLIDPGRS